MSTLYTAFSDDTSFPGIRYLPDIEEREWQISKKLYMDCVILLILQRYFFLSFSHFLSIMHEDVVRVRMIGVATDMSISTWRNYGLRRVA